MVPTTSLVLASLSLFSGLTLAQSCKENSCLIADVSGSTGHRFDGRRLSEIPEVTPDGQRCIENAYSQLNLPPPSNYVPLTLPATYAGRPDWFTSRRAKRGSIGDNMSLPQDAPVVARDTSDVEESLESRQLFGIGCKPKTLIWARGTLDPPIVNNMGVIIGPSIQGGLDQAQPGQWNTVGVEYTADFNGIFCVGMPGGLSCMKKLNELGAQCPDTKFIVAGYSQGAMIAHECVAFAEKSVRDRVAGVVVYGDPFNGAPIRDFPSSKIKTFCDPNDGVCGGRLNIGLGHFSYSIGDAGTQGVRWILSQV